MTARASVDAAAGSVRVEIDIAAPPERVFTALSDPRELEAWWGSPEMYRTFDWQLDLRPGGKWSCRARAGDGEISTVSGEYRAVDPPRLLEYTWLASWEGPVATLVRIEIAPVAGGSRVVVLHTGFTSAPSATSHGNGWMRVLGWLQNAVQEVSP